ncbi:MAG TPA: MFS transporter [Acidimicrobiales bacterium]|nr:MFS transporter [Acidimicrobiales bacterium]
MSTPTTETRMTPGLVALFAVACGISAANLYYAQPLLPRISRDLHVGSGTAALVITAAQIGYGIGLALIVPLGDILIRRRLVPFILVIAAAALLAASAAPNVTVLIVAVTVAGLCSVAAQILVPFAASLATDQQRGRVVGTVMSGLLLGILLARTFSGLIAEAAGWRTVYVVASGVVLTLSGVLHLRLPGEQRRPSMVYSELLGSVVHLMRTEPVLRLRSAIGGLAFATFNVIWTSLAFLLVSAPYHYGPAVIGLFGLLGAAGALAASFSGRLADRGLERWVTGGSLVITLGSIALLAVGAHQLWALIAGIVIGDLGIQAVHIQNQQLIFAIEPSARSRLNTGYMVTYFIGGAVGSATTGLAYAARGWSGVIALGLVYSGAGLALWAVSEVLRRRGGPAARSAPVAVRPPA